MLRRVVAQARTLLEEDVKTQLNRFGIEEGGSTVPIDRLGHLGANDAEMRDKILASINKEQGKRIELTEAYDRYVRHVGFTYLNRIAALRAMEARGLLEKETVIRRDKYAGLSERAYEISERQGVSNSGESTRLCFLEAFAEVSQEIRVLFDINDEYSVLFPSQGVLEKVIQLISIDVPEDDWHQEDIIGWIYQYYNSEARQELREKRRKLRADDVPVVNQFYTSHWLVRALVDNTLGRLWLEMKGRMPKPGNGVAPSLEHLRNPHGENVDDYCSYLIPSKQESPARESKPVRDLKILDPACGSGHFLVYAFNVLYRMYLEDEPQTPKEEIPRLILENNLFGIDIDLRSVQLAALSLYLKAKEYNPETKITKMNIVCADVRIINGDLKKAFLKRLEPDVDLQRIFIKLFEELEYTFDIGSLLKVRTPFEKLIEDRGPQAHFQVLPSGQTSFSRVGLSAQTSIGFRRQTNAATIEPAVTLSDMLEALIAFEKEGLEKRDMGSMLFAVEAEKSVGLLSLLSQKYDVVVMNPPYGEFPGSAEKYVKSHYPRTHSDYYAAFIEQAVDLSEENGLVGMLTGRTFMFLKKLEKVRTEILLGEARSEIVYDLNSSAGDNILDEATARWAATVARKHKKSEGNECIFVRLTPFEGEDKKINALERAISLWLVGKEDDSKIFTAKKLVTLKKLPRMPYSYWVPDSIADLFEKNPPLDKDNAGRYNKPKIADLRQGLATADKDRFVRYWWEVDNDAIALSKDETFEGRKWVPIARGGEAYYDSIPLVVNWEKDGSEIRNRMDPKTGHTYSNIWMLENTARNLFFKGGLCWSKIVSSVLLDFRVLPRGCIFGDAAHALFLPSNKISASLIGLLNSSLLSCCFLALDPTMHNRHVGYVSQLPISSNALENKDIERLTLIIESIKKEWQTGNETSYDFTIPYILKFIQGLDQQFPANRHPLSRFAEDNKENLPENLRNIHAKKIPSIQESVQLSEDREVLLFSEVFKLQKSIDELVYTIYSVNDQDRLIIEKELNLIRMFTGESKNGNINFKPRISKKEHVERLLSYYVKILMETDSDGIILLDKLTENVRQKISYSFESGKEKTAEFDITQVLGKPLSRWLIEDYFSFHVSLYERRPIFWHLTSSNFSSTKNSVHSFNCLLYYQKLNRDTLPKIRTRQEYLKGMLDGARWRVEGLRREIQKNSLDSKRESHLQAEYIEALAEFSELQAFEQRLAEVSNPRNELTKLGKNPSWVEQKIAEVRDNGWNPIIDYGVRVNIEPLKEAKLLHSAADRVK